MYLILSFRNYANFLKFCETVSTPICMPTAPRWMDMWLHNGHSIALISNVWMTSHTATDTGQNPEERFGREAAATLVGRSLNQKNKSLCHVWWLACCRYPVTQKWTQKLRREPPATSCYSVNLQTRMAGIHWQIAVTEQRTLQWTNPFKHSAFWREWKPAKTGHLSCITIVPFLMQRCCLSRR